MITIYISAYQVPDTIKSSLNKVLDFHSNLEIIVTAFLWSGSLNYLRPHKQHSPNLQGDCKTHTENGKDKLNLIQIIHYS